MADSTTKTTSMIQFGKLGIVTEEVLEMKDVEIFAKYQNSVNGDAGPHYTDDCHLSAPGGQQHPCTALTLLP